MANSIAKSRNLCDTTCVRTAPNASRMQLHGTMAPKNLFIGQCQMTKLNIEDSSDISSKP